MRKVLAYPDIPNFIVIYELKKFPNSKIPKSPGAVNNLGGKKE
jgi:hypothetical protein